MQTKATSKYVFGKSVSLGFDQAVTRVIASH